MILYIRGDLFESPAQVLVNTVNTVGVMGKGIALRFKQIYPDMFAQYRELCEKKDLTIGKLWLFKSLNKWVLNFPTKQDWREPSRIDYIKAGLQAFVLNYSRLGIHSVAFPALGCGNGQLEFSDVGPVMEQFLKSIPIDVFIYPPMPNQTRPEHLEPELMHQWLRSEPSNLPFSEVWVDLLKILEEKDTFETPSEHNRFSVSACQGQQFEGLKVTTNNGEKILISIESLAELWKQLRTYGFTMRQIAPGIDRHLSYIIPVLSELEYIKPVEVAKDFVSLKQKPIRGLQLYPIIGRNRKLEIQTLQLKLR